MKKDRKELLEEKNRYTIFHELLNAPSLPASEKTEIRLHHEAQSFVGAGTETTAHALRVATFHLADKPHLVRKLREEFRTLPQGLEPIPLLQKLEQLPYFTGVLLEGLRLSYGAVTRLPRIDPDNAIVYKKFVIPPGTPVGMSHLLMYHDESIYPDSYAFKPERWVDPADRRRLERYFEPFLRGTRNCMGIQ